MLNIIFSNFDTARNGRDPVSVGKKSSKNERRYIDRCDIICRIKTAITADE